MEWLKLKERNGDDVFSYNDDVKDKKFFITIPTEIKYNFRFLNAITELIFKVENTNCEKVYVLCTSQDINFNKMGMAYLYNTLLFIAKNKHVFISISLMKLVHEQVSHSAGDKFEQVDLYRESMKSVQQCYCFQEDKAVNQTVQILVDFISDKNLILENAKEFLITTIGEIFSNAFNHSEQNRVFFMYDIERHSEKSFLVINITDYGKTIIGNVQEYQKSVYGKYLSGIECIEWAMRNGNTTRMSSGGYGLPTLVDYVSMVNGELLIFSGDCMYALKGTNENILKAKGIFLGTSISMKIPLFDTSKAIMYDEESKRVISIDLNQI